MKNMNDRDLRFRSGLERTLALLVRRFSDWAIVHSLLFWWSWWIFDHWVCPLLGPSSAPGFACPAPPLFPQARSRCLRWWLFAAVVLISGCGRLPLRLPLCLLDLGLELVPSLLPGMALRYSAARLLLLNTHSTPSCISAIKYHGLLRRPRYIHRGSGRKFVYLQTGHSIPVLWSAQRTPTHCPSAPGHSNAHDRTSCLQTLAKSPEFIPTIQNNIKLTLFNTRSLNNKSLILNDYILDNKLDFLCLTETWQQHLDYFSLNLTTPNGYCYINKPRSEGRGGGIAVIHRQDIKTSLISISSAPSFEHLAFKLSGHTQSVMAVVYRPSQTTPIIPV
uniref:uncharacterized protein n=1 Tax=Myxine glutinosa TaxID=7769 RepID=UPI00358FB352